MMMGHLLASVPNKHVFLHLENKTFWAWYLCSTTVTPYNAVCHTFELKLQLM